MSKEVPVTFSACINFIPAEIITKIGIFGGFVVRDAIFWGDCYTVSLGNIVNLQKESNVLRRDTREWILLYRDTRE